MNNFTFYSPTFFQFGKDAELEVGRLIRRFGGTRVLIHYGGGSVIRSGLLDRIRGSLTEAGLEYLELGGVQPNPRSGLVYRGIQLCRDNVVDFILAVGGGSTIDSSKAIALGTPFEGDFWDFYEGKPVEKALPLGTVLTISAAGSEGSPDSVITHEDGMRKRSAHGDVIRARFSVLNPCLTMTLPPYQTACGLTDILAHLYERYLTNTQGVETTDRLIEALMLSVIHEAPRVMADPCCYDARANIMWAAMMAHNNICGVGRTQDWTSHKLEHELSALYDCAHGAGLAVAMPAVFTYNLQHDPQRFAQAAQRVWGCEADPADPVKTGLAGIEALRKFLASIGMPLRFADIGAKEDDIPQLAHACFCNPGDPEKLGGFVPLDEAAVAEIYRLMV